MRSKDDLNSAFRDFISGDGVERIKLELIYDGKNVVEQFLHVLKNLNFEPTTVSRVFVQPGERVPAFLVQDSTAYFGWIFWEKFTQKKMRKLWGSIVRNRKGDWAIQIPSNRETTIYANPALKSEMDIDRPM